MSRKIEAWYDLKVSKTGRIGHFLLVAVDGITLVIGIQ